MLRLHIAFFCGRRRGAVARYRMICLVLKTYLTHFHNTDPDAGCWLRVGSSAPACKVLPSHTDLQTKRRGHSRALKHMMIRIAVHVVSKENVRHKYFKNDQLTHAFNNIASN